MALILCRTAGAASPLDSPAGTTNAPITLDDARCLAFARNWDLLAARSDVDIATAQRLAARAVPNPTLSVGVAKISVDGVPNSTSLGNDFWERSYDTVIAVSQLLEIGGKRRARTASATAGKLSAEARLADARRLLDAGIVQSYVAALLAEQTGKVLRDSAGSLREEARIAAARQRAGDISVADQSQIEIAADRLEIDATNAVAAARTARIALEVLLGERQPAGAIRLATPLDDLAQMPGAAAPDAPSTTGSSLDRPDIRAAEAMHSKALADLRLQRAQRVPDPTFFVQYEHEPPDQPNTIGVGVSFPLPLWNRNRGNIAAAEVAAAQAAREVERLRAQASAEIAAATGVYTAATARWHRYREELLPKSQAIRSTVAYAYQRGGASLLDLLSAERNDNDIRLATAQAAADTANAAAALRAALTRADPQPSSPP